MGKAAIKKLQKERALLNAAFCLFLKNGIRNTAISDITEKAGVAKGTFYLYFKDKFDIRDKLVTSKTSEIFLNAYNAMLKTPVAERDIDYQILFLVEHSVDHLCKDHRLLEFIISNLEWGAFSDSITSRSDSQEKDAVEVYRTFIEQVKMHYCKVEIMLFMVIELTTSTCYNAALYGKPLTIEELKPELFGTIRAIMDHYRIDNE